MWQLPKLDPEEILVYLRKSRTDDPLLTVQEVLAKHEQMLDDWAEANLPGPIPESNRYREIVSGETIDSRPQVQAVLSRVESPKMKALLITEPQRLSRGDLEDIGRLVKILRYTNTLVITLQYSYDLRDDRDRDDFERELKRGNEFLEYQKRIMSNGRRISVENGSYVGARPPYGYKKIMVKEGRRSCPTLEIVPEEAEVVRMIFEMFAQGLGSHKIARTLNELGIPAPKGDKWVPEGLSRVRHNEHYLGHVVWGRRKKVKSIEDGELVVTRPFNSEYLRYNGKHEAIIDQDLWDRVQETCGKIPRVKDKARCVNPLAGLLFCECGRFMCYRTYKQNGVERAPARFICHQQTICKNASSTVDEILTEVVKVLQDAIEDFDIRTVEAASDQVEQHRQRVTRLTQRLAQLDQLEINQWEKYTMESMPKSVFDALNEKLLREREEVQQALCDAKDSLPDPVDFEAKRVMFSNALAALQDPDAPALKKNLLLKQCIERIEYSRKRNERLNRPAGPMELDIHLLI